MINLKIITGIILLSVHLIYGQEIEYAVVKYDHSQGMPTSEVYAVMEDSKGYLWFTTEVGVSRYDGYKFRNFSVSDGLTGYTAFRSFEDSFGRIWFTMFNGGLSFYQNDSIYAYPFNAILDSVIPPKKWITYLDVDAGQNLHFFSSNSVSGTISSKGVFTKNEDLLMAGSKLDVLFPENKNEFPQVSFVRGSDVHNRLRLEVNIGNDTTYLLDKESTVGINFSDLNKDGYEFIIGNEMIYVTRNGLIRIIKDENSLGVSVDNEQKVWIRKYGQGIEIYENARDVNLGAEPEYKILEDLSVSRILFKENGEAWLAIQNQGVQQILNHHVKNYTVNGVYRKQKIVSVFKDQKNDIYYASEHGKLILVNQNEKHTLYRDLDLNVNRVYKDSGGQLIVSVFGARETHDAKDLEVVQGRTFAILDDDLMWKANGTILVLERHGQEIYNSKNDDINDYFSCIYEDNLNRTFIGGQMGLYIFEEGALKQIEIPNTDRKFPICDIDQFSDGTVLAGARNGELIFLITKNEEIYIRRLKLDIHLMMNLHIDAENTIWISWGNGLLRLDFDSNYNYTTFNITAEHGLASNEINDISSRGHMIYVATNKGLSVFSKNDLIPNQKPPKVHIERVAINEKEITLDKEHEFSYENNYLEFSFVGICFRKQGNVQYQYRLKGIDSNWQQTIARDVRYPSLVPGAYTFEVKACNEDDFWSQPEQFSFVIHKPYWNQSWFVILTTVLGIIILFTFIQIVRRNALARQEKNKQIERQKRKIIETELKALRAQMNPHFTFNILNSLQNSIKKFDQKKALKYTNDFSLLMRKVLENSQSLFISIQEEIEMLNLYVELENMRINYDIEYLLTIDPKIDLEFQEIPSMIIQPIVENAIIHGLSPKLTGSKKLHIQLLEKPNGILCLVEDNGIGREKSNILNKQKKLNKTSMGTSITKDRLELFYAEVGKRINFKIIDLYDQNQESTGTRVEFFFNY